MVTLSDRYLVLRGEDHLVLGVQWWGADGLSPLTIHGGGGLVVTFPPQHVGEGAFDAGLSLFLSSGQLSGLSQIAVQVAAETTIFLSTREILKLLAAGTVVQRFDDGTSGSVIELPYALRWTPTGPAAITIVHPRDPVEGPTTAVPLWRTELRSSGGIQVGAPAVVGHGPDPTALVLSAQKLQDIVDAGAPLAAVHRAELSTLGGSLTARGEWPNLSWTQDIALGRDQHVRIALHGVLYPFGHRATYVEATDREFTEVDGTAALRIKRTLLVTEPVKSVVVGDATLNRQFPFDDVEITATTFGDLGPMAMRNYTRPTPDTSEIDTNIAQLDAEINQLLFDLADAVNATWAPGDLGTAADDDYVNLRQELAPLEAQLADFRDRRAQADDLDVLVKFQLRELQRLESVPVDADGVSPVQDAIDAANAELSRLDGLLAELAAPSKASIDQFDQSLNARRDRLAQLLAAIAPLLAPPHSIDALVAHGTVGAIEVQGKQDQVKQLQQDKADLLALVVARDWILGPTRLGGAPLRIPVRCTTRSGDQPPLTMDVPMIFVVEFHVEAEHGLPAFDSLTDSDGPQPLADLLGACFANHGAGLALDTPSEPPPWPRGAEVPIGGALVDVVHAAQTAAGDRVEVHGITLTGVPNAGAFAPVVARYQAVVPAVRAMLGDAQGVVKDLVYAPRFLTNGEAEDVAVHVVGAPLGIDFRAQANRSGALLAPVIEATGLSRRYGPVAANALEEAAGVHLDPAKLLGEGASILGFDLRSLLAGVTKPPTIVQQLVDGGPPQATIEWDATISSNAIIDAAAFPGAAATFTLTARLSAAGAATRCRIERFALCFPTVADALLRLTFKSVTFSQEPGREPDLKVEVDKVSFLGDLKLLEDLQNKVDLGGNLPKVKVATDRIGVAYAFAVPNADCGEFTLRNIALRAGLDVPFQPTDDDPITLTFGFASRVKPFNLSVMALGGGGYIEMQLDRTGLRKLELSLEFGATVALSFAIVSAEAHVLGGVRTEIGPGDHRSITGFIRIGGVVELLGLVTIAIELVVNLVYLATTNELFGEATLVIDVDLTLYSHSFELDSGQWRLLGGSGPAIGLFDAAVDAVDDGGFEAWKQYRDAFDLVVVA